MKNFIKISLLLAILKSLNYWVLWQVDARIFHIALIFSIIYSNSNGNICVKSIKNIYKIALGVLSVGVLYFNSLVLKEGAGLLSYSSMIIFLMTVILIFRLSRDFRDEIIGFLEKSFGWLLLPAIAVFFINRFWELPFIPTPYIDSFGDMPYGIFRNYIFYIQGIGVETLLGFERFSGPFIEPGQMATFLSFLLILNRYEFSKQHWHRSVILLAIFVSFSLAGWVIAGIAALLFRLSSIKKALSYILLIVVMYYGGQSYNDGNNVVNKYIIERLEYDEEKGISGNDRSGKIMNDIYDESVASDLQYLMFGAPQYRGDKMDGGSGYKAFLIQFGLFPLIFILAYYLLLSQGAGNKRDMYILSLLVVLSFLQRATPVIFYMYVITPLLLDHKPVKDKI